MFGLASHPSVLLFLFLFSVTKSTSAFLGPATVATSTARTTTSRVAMSPRPHNFTESSTTESTSVARSSSSKDPSLPGMIVFDLDDCLWSPEMYTLWTRPSIPVKGDLGLGDGRTGVIGLKVPPAGPTVRLFPGARQVLRELAANPKYANVILAAASSSEEPSYSYACLEAIEILPGLTMRHMFKYDQIGRTGQLTSDKRTHFQLLHAESNVPYSEMLFFDDCNWGDHCATVSRAFGVVSQRTPSGLQYSEFEEALEKYKKEAEKRAEMNLDFLALNQR